MAALCPACVRGGRGGKASDLRVFKGIFRSRCFHSRGKQAFTYVATRAGHTGCTCMLSICGCMPRLQPTWGDALHMLESICLQSVYAQILCAWIHAPHLQ